MPRPIAVAGSRRVRRLAGGGLVWAGVWLPLAAGAAGGAATNGERDPYPRALEPAAQTVLAGVANGEVRKVDPATGRVTLKHGPIEALGMPGMTMVFRVRDPGWLARLRVGDRIRFVAQRVDGALTLTSYERVQP